MKARFLWVFALVLLIALGLRLPRLAERPLHNDEAVNGIKFRTLWQGGGYRYDPHEYHGPALPYATLAGAWVRHRGDRAVEPDEVTLRLVPVLFGLGLVLVPLVVRSALGRSAALASAALTALSPVMVYYSRYYIHELLLVFFSFLFLAAAWRYRHSPRTGWAALAGLSLGGMQAAKETFVIPLAAAAAALVATFLWTRWKDVTAPAPWRVVRGTHMAIGLAAALVVSVTLFTSFFTNAAGPLDAFRTYLPWLDRAGGASPHIRPWFFYGERLLWFHFPRGPVWTEAFVLGLALVGFGAALAGRGLAEASASWSRFLGFYAFALASAYSLIGYKTPWCALGFWQPMLLLAGLGMAVLFRFCQGRGLRMILVALLIAGSAHLAFQAWRASYPDSWRRQNPWVFAHTSADILKLVERVRALADLHPQGRGALLKVMAPDDDYWPLPWYFRDFPNVGYYSAVPPEPMAPIVLASVQLEASLETRPGRTHLMAGMYELRPQPAGVPPTTFELYVELDLWKAYLKAHPPNPEDD